MKLKFLSLMTMAIMVIACQSQIKSDHEQSASTQTSVAIPFSGQWLSENYYQFILNDRSPRKAQEETNAMFIKIPDSTNQKTSMIYRFHEAGPELVVRQVDGQFQIWEMQGDTLYELAFQVESQSDGRLKIGDQLFINIHAEEKDNFFQILEEILFKGIYVLPDGREVEWKANGEISGWDEFSYYHVLQDYMDAGLQVDQVGLGWSAEDALHSLAFKMKADRLELYKVKCKTFSEEENRCLEVDFGKQAFVLLRK